MKVLFINPPFERLKGIAHIYFPLGLGYLCAAISEDKRIDAKIYNAELPDFSERLLYHAQYQDMLKLYENYIRSLNENDHYVWREAASIIKEYEPDLVGITVMTAKYGSALKISEIAKSLNPKCAVVWGGPHASIDSERALENECVDIAVRQEGEATLKDLINLMLEKSNILADDLSKIEGITYKNGKNIIQNKNRPLAPDLDLLSFPEKERVFFPERYLPSSYSDMITLRGCPFKCGYCGAHNVWTHKVRYRSINKILEEIGMIISRYKTRKFYFWDDSFTLNRERVIELCRALNEKKLGISWGCTTRVDLLDDSLVNEMKTAGCNYISIGIETASERMLDKIDKGITLKKIDSAIDLLNKNHLKYEAFFMVGFPEETKEDIEKTLSFMRQLKKADICFSIFTPYPGTQQYEIARINKLIPEEVNWSHFSHQSRDNHFMKYLNREEFGEYVEKISAWIDEHNTINIEILRLLKDSFLNFGALIKRPKLLLNKLNTFLIIMEHKIRILFKIA